MIIDRVEITSEARSESHWLCWMQQVRIPDVIRTGCFSSYRIVVDSAAAEPVFVMQYHCRLLEEYHRYRDDLPPACKKRLCQAETRSENFPCLATGF